MKVIINFPESEEDMAALKERANEFHAILMIEKIKQLHITDASKQKLLGRIVEYFKEKSA